MNERLVPVVAVAAALLLMTSAPLLGGDPAASETDAQRDARMAWWREARFGMFVHWGLYAIAGGEWDDGRVWKSGGQEWIQKLGEIPADVYAARLLPRFKPKQDFAREWARVAKEGGARYVVFTSKHHEGFALHDSKLTDFDAMDACGRDLTREIVDAVRDEGLKVGLYHSIIDWHHPHAYTAGGLPTIKGTNNEGRDHNKYLEFLHGQARELMTHYGKIDVIWWDYSSDRIQGEKWKATELMTMVRSLQPHIISNNRLYKNLQQHGDSFQAWDRSRGDFTTPEQHIPATGLPGVDWEVCMTMNNTWGWSNHDHAWKSPETLLHNLIDIVSKGGNYLLNIGPKPDGSVPEQSVAAMRHIGAWLAINGEAIHGTHASTLATPKNAAWRCTTKPGVLYLHLLKWPGASFTVEGATGTASKATILGSDQPLNVSQDGEKLTVTLPSAPPAKQPAVIKVELR